MSQNKKRRSSVSKQKSSEKAIIKKSILTPKIPKNCQSMAEDEEIFKSSIKKIYALNDRLFENLIIENNMIGAEAVLNEVLQKIEELNYGSRKKAKFQQLSVYLTNKAFVEQEQTFIIIRLGKSAECVKSMQMAVLNYQLLQSYLLSREENVAHSLEFVKLNLMYFGCLSKISKHLEVILAAEKCISKLAESLRVLTALCAESLVHSGTPDTIATQTESRVRTEKVDFKRVVLKEASRMLKGIDLSSPHKLVTEGKQKFEQKLKNIYFWKDNNENNAKVFKKESSREKTREETSSCRNLLGVQKSSSVAEQFSLGELMTLSPRKMKQKLNSDQYFLLSSPKIVEIELLASVCYFTIATETRFNELSEEISSMKITEKYQRLNKDESIFRCKVLHLKAIQLAALHLPPSNAYFKHILNCFNQNYKIVLDQINQESESSMRSYNKSLEKYKAEQSSFVMNAEYGMEKIKNTLRDSAKVRKVTSSTNLTNLQKSISVDISACCKPIRNRIRSKQKMLQPRKKSIASKKGNR